MIYVGIDWGDKRHAVTIIDDNSEPHKPLHCFYTPNDFEGALSVVSACLDIEADPDKILVCFEATRLPFLDFLMEQGFLVFCVNPKLSARFRDRFHVSGKKDDFADSRVIAWIVKHERRILQALPRASLTPTVHLRIHCARYSDLVESKTALINSLTSTLKKYYPLALRLMPNLDANIALSFLEHFPSPDSLKDVSLEQFRRFFSDNGYTHPARVEGKYKLSRRPHLHSDPVAFPAFARSVLSLVRRLRLIVEETKDYEKIIAAAAHSHPLYNRFRSLPAVSDVTIGQLIAFLGDDNQIFSSYRGLQQLAGTAPVTFQSGAMQSVRIRRACSRRGRRLFQQIAYSWSKNVPWAREYYLSKLIPNNPRSAQKVLRSLANIIVKIVFAMWRDGSEYDETIFMKRRAAHNIARLEQRLVLNKRKDRSADGNKCVADTTTGSPHRPQALSVCST